MPPQVAIGAVGKIKVSLTTNLAHRPESHTKITFYKNEFRFEV